MEILDELSFVHDDGFRGFDALVVKWEPESVVLFRVWRALVNYSCVLRTQLLPQLSRERRHTRDNEVGFS